MKANAETLNEVYTVEMFDIYCKNADKMISQGCLGPPKCSLFAVDCLHAHVVVCLFKTFTCLIFRASICATKFNGFQLSSHCKGLWLWFLPLLLPICYIYILENICLLATLHGCVGVKYSVLLLLLLNCCCYFCCCPQKSPDLKV